MKFAVETKPENAWSLKNMIPISVFIARALVFRRQKSVLKVISKTCFPTQPQTFTSKYEFYGKTILIASPKLCKSTEQFKKEVSYWRALSNDLRTSFVLSHHHQQPSIICFLWPSRSSSTQICLERWKKSRFGCFRLRTSSWYLTSNNIRREICISRRHHGLVTREPKDLFSSASRNRPRDMRRFSTRLAKGRPRLITQKLPVSLLI